MGRRENDSLCLLITIARATGYEAAITAMEQHLIKGGAELLLPTGQEMSGTKNLQCREKFREFFLEFGDNGYFEEKSETFAVPFFLMKVS